MRILLLIPVALFLWGCEADPLPTEPTAATIAPNPEATAKVALPPMPGQASLEFWEAMDAYMAEGRIFLPKDFETDENDKGRTFLEYLPRDHPWHDHTDRFRYESGSSHPTHYTLMEILDPEDELNGNSLILQVDARQEWRWDSLYGTRGEMNARYKQTFHQVLKLVRTMHRFRAGTTVFYGYPTLEADIRQGYPNDKGKTFSDLFPGPLPFANAYTGLVTEPGYGVHACNVGEMVLEGLMDEYGLTHGFMIEARGYSNNEYLAVRYTNEIEDHPWIDKRGGPSGQDENPHH